MMKKIVVLSVSFLAVSAGAAEVADAKKRWSGDSELGFVKTSGNSNSETLSAKQSIVYDAHPWRNTLKLEATNASSEVVDTTTGDKTDQRTVEKYYVSEQLDHFFSERSYGFLRSTYDKNRFSGFENQSTVVVGYGRTLADLDSFDMKMEIGYGTGRDKIDECDAPVCDPDAGKANSSGLIYLSEDLAWKMSEPSTLGQNLSVEETDDNRKSRFSVYIKSQMLNSLAMKVTYSLKYQDEVPIGQKHRDEELTASLVYSY